LDTSRGSGKRSPSASPGHASLVGKRSPEDIYVTRGAKQVVSRRGDVEERSAGDSQTRTNARTPRGRVREGRYIDSEFAPREKRERERTNYGPFSPPPPCTKVDRTFYGGRGGPRARQKNEDDSHRRLASKQARQARAPFVRGPEGALYPSLTRGDGAGGI